jgi:hypothetical protein
VKHIDKSPQPEAYADWQLIGEFELPTNPNAENIIHARLIEILGSLNLHADFLDKILKSAQDALQHVLSSNPMVPEFEQIHLLVFTQSLSTAGLRTWGFFRIEKAESAVQNERQLTHRIEIYLYPEG